MKLAVILAVFVCVCVAGYLYYENKQLEYRLENLEVAVHHLTLSQSHLLEALSPLFGMPDTVILWENNHKQRWGNNYLF